MSNIEYFEKQIKYWAKKLRIGKVKIVPRKMWAFASVYWDESIKIFNYNPKQVKIHDRATLMEVIFHEFGHLYKNNGHKQYPYGENLNKQICEHIAQRRAFYWLKKYYPNYYKEQVKWIYQDINQFLKQPQEKDYYFLGLSQPPEYAQYLTPEE